MQQNFRGERERTLGLEEQKKKKKRKNFIKEVALKSLEGKGGCLYAAMRQRVF